jgi:hypothetical protein
MACQGIIHRTLFFSAGQALFGIASSGLSGPNRGAGVPVRGQSWLPSSLLSDDREISLKNIPDSLEAPHSVSVGYSGCTQASPTAQSRPPVSKLDGSQLCPQAGRPRHQEGGGTKITAITQPPDYQ